MTEFELIYRYFEQHAPRPSQQHTLTQASIVKSLGDDAAVVAFNKNSQLVTCVDTLIQGRHFSHDWAQVNELAFAIGFKAVAVNVSDLAAMGAKPHSILLALSLPKRLANEAWLTQFSKGLLHACQQFDIQLIGGDTTRHDQLVISVTANGLMQEGIRPIYRSGAKIGDKVYVSGTLGDASYALNRSDNKIGQQLAHRLHMPTPRSQLGQALAYQGLASAMIDISDGLIQDLEHICNQSKVAMRIELANLPVSEALQAVDLSERLKAQMTGGDDYELAFTLPLNISSPSLDSINGVIGGTKVTCIGEVIDTMTMTEDTSRIQLTYQGQQLTNNDPYPFETMPTLAGFQHFS